jgi:hypothetical protein
VGVIPNLIMDGLDPSIFFAGKKDARIKCGHDEK